jgi:hypothetical protein
VPNWLPKFVTVLGVICVGIGVVWGFVEGGGSFQFLDCANCAGFFLITLAAGILLSAGGTVAWTRRLGKQKKLRVAGVIFLVALAAFIVVPNNVHGPGMLLGLVAICAGILSLVLVVMAIFAPNPASS